MKCRSCHADLHIDDEVCRYCDTVNPRFKKHRKNMKRYQTEFSYTKKDVYATVEKTSKQATFIVAIAVLAMINVALLILNANLWEIDRWMRSNEIENNKETHQENTNTLLADENYLDFHLYADKHSLLTGETFDDYTRVIHVASVYYRVYDYLISYTTDEEYYLDAGDLSMRISENLTYAYNYSTQDEYDRASQFTPELVETMENIIQAQHVLLITYANIDEQTANNFQNLSEAERALIIEEGLKNEK